MPKHWFIIGLLLLPQTLLALEPEAKLQTIIWKENVEVHIKGTDLLGEVPDQRLLCFSPEAQVENYLCYKHDHSNVLEWKSTLIRFIPPANSPPNGVITAILIDYKEQCRVSGNAQLCGNVTYQRPVELGRYKAHPYIIDIVDQDLQIPVTTLERGRTYVIRGVRFGEIGTLLLGRTKLDSRSVSSWQYNEIIFTPSVTINETTMQVQTAAAKSNAYNVQAVEKVSNDPYASLQHHLHYHNVPAAWKKTRGENIIVAVIDSGVDTNHEEFAGRIWKNKKEIRNNKKDDDGNGFVDDTSGWNFAEDSPELTPASGHGTAVAGVIAAAKDNNTGVAGVAPRVTVMPLIVATKEGKISSQDVAEAIEYAVDNGADIINLSLGGRGFTTDFNPSFTPIIEKATKNNVLVVIAAGNGDVTGSLIGAAQGVNLNQNPKSPICNRKNDSQTIGVASITSTGDRSRFSDYGDDCVDAAAIGENVVTTMFYALDENKLNYSANNGTSFSAPIVSGIAALVWSANPNLTAVEVREAILSSGRRTNGRGIGTIVDAMEAVETGEKLASGQKVTTVRTRDTDEEKNDEDVLFSDIAQSHPYHDAISWGKQRKVLQGYADGSFRPDRSVNRAEFLKIILEADPNVDLTKALDPTGFPDVDETAWYAPYVRYAKKFGIIEGYPDGTFRPEQTINFAEALKIAYETLGVDTEDIGGAWFSRYLAHAKYNRILFSNDASMASNAARKDVMWIVWKLLEN